MYRLTTMPNNQFTVQILDAFVNEGASSSPSELTDVYIVMEFFEFDMNNLLSTDDIINDNQAKTLIYNLLLTL